MEGRISVLYRIRKDKKTLDSILSFCPAPEMGVEREMDPTVPCVVSAPTQSRNPWDELGAKPRALANSTPLPEPWIEPGNRRGRRSSRVPLPSRHIKLTNRFAVLDEEEFPYLDGRSSSSMVHSTASVGQRSRMVAPRSLKPDFPSARARSGFIHPPSADHLVRAHSPAPPASLSEPSLRPLRPYSLVIGTSDDFSPSPRPDNRRKRKSTADERHIVGAFMDITNKRHHAFLLEEELRQQRENAWLRSEREEEQQREERLKECREDREQM
ncbi:hypothetical protein NHX12_004113 [Muraenolepis orangiensis]|uniref:Uncharacterized protein n=1 Tax=Muraenolepis orangiensis TaxID=630683 RepID=A0A9Q0IBV6_9TELE|nr:hypothetical protein NHX12_004113 [Muraenolepis orangiensis]